MTATWTWPASVDARHEQLRRLKVDSRGAELSTPGRVLRKLVSDKRYERGIELLEGVVAVLTKMV